DAEPSSPEPAPPAAYSFEKTAPEPAPAPTERPPVKKSRPVLDEKAKQLARERYQHLTPEKPSTNLLDYAYWLLLLTFLPLAFSLLHESKEDTIDRLVRTLEKAFPPKEEKTAAQPKAGPKGRPSVPVISDEPDLP